MAKPKQPKTLQQAANMTAQLGAQQDKGQAAPQKLTAPAEAPKAEPTEKPKTEMSMLEKVEIMSDLTSACRDKELISMIKSRSHGDRIFDIFVNSIEREVASIMSGKQEQVPNEVINLLSYTKQLQGATNSFRDLIVGFMNTPLVQVLNLLNQNMGGKKFDLDSINAAAQQHAATQQQQPQQQPQQHHQQEYSEPSGRGGRGSAGGLGSY